MNSKNQLLSNILQNHSGQLQQLQHPLSRKLHFYISAIVFIAISLVILLTIALQTLKQPSPNTFIYYVLIIGISVSCLASLGVFFLSKKLTAPIARLSITAKQISHGNFGAQSEISSDDEIGLLAKNINLLSIQLHELQIDKEQSTEQLESIVLARTKGIQWMHDRLENILKTSSQGFWRVDNDMITEEINPRMAEILNYTQEEIVGRSIMDFVGIPNKTILHKQIHRGKSLLSTEYEIELKRKNGTFIPCLFNATPLMNEQGDKDGSFVMVTDISALKQTEKNLQEAKRMAEHASHEKSSFLANMSHEIRTPLNGIIGSLELLQDKRLPPSKQKQFMETARESADFLLILLNNILDLSKIEADKIEMEKVAFMPGILLSQLHTMFITQTKAKGLQLKLTADETVPEILIGDEFRLTQICTNLLSNAIKFTQEGSVSMSLTCKAGGDRYVLLQCRVSDTGIGFPVEKQELVFDSFTQADTSTTREFGGTGLGLALCKKLCSLMGGKIWVESVKGEGSTFSFNVLLGIGELDLLSVDKKENDDELLTDITIPQLDILVVDDNNINRDVAEMFFTREGHHVETAVNGLQALQLLSRKRFDCVFMDIQMPEMDGVTATGIIRECEQNNIPPESLDNAVLSRQLHDKIQGTHTPIIALTANVFQSDKQKYLEAGMDDYLGKPIRGKDIHRVLLKITEQDEYEENEDHQATPSIHEEMTADKKVTLSGIQKYLKDMYSFESSQIDTLIATSVTCLNEGLDMLDQACLTKDNKALTQNAHRLKGSLLNLGLVQQAELAKRIETSAKENSEHPYSLWINELRQDLDPLQTVL